jgi:hypothetical protein
MRKPLEYFNELERLGPLLGVPITMESVINIPDLAHVAPTQVKVYPGSARFLEVLERIETSIAYFDDHPEFKDTNLYRTKMIQV